MSGLRVVVPCVTYLLRCDHEGAIIIYTYSLIRYIYLPTPLQACTYTRFILPSLLVASTTPRNRLLSRLLSRHPSMGYRRRVSDRVNINCDDGYLLAY